MPEEMVNANVTLAQWNVQAKGYIATLQAIEATTDRPLDCLILHKINWLILSFHSPIQPHTHTYTHTHTTHTYHTHTHTYHTHTHTHTHICIYIFIYSQRISSFYFRPSWSGFCVSLLFLLRFPFFYFVSSVCKPFFSPKFFLCSFVYFFILTNSFIHLFFLSLLYVSLLLRLATLLALSWNLTFYRK
jgi:hypothetical protein